MCLAMSARLAADQQQRCGIGVASAGPPQAARAERDRHESKYPDPS